MLNKVRRKLQRSLKAGFWFPVFTRASEHIYVHVSLGYAWNRWLAQDGEWVEGASESYQAVSVIIGVAWLAVIDRPLFTVLATKPAIWFGLLVVLYRITEILLFSVHWVFGARKELGAIRRSLAAFLINLVELSLLFSIAFILAGCCVFGNSKTSVLYNHLKNTWTLELAAPCAQFGCGLLAHYEVIVAGVVISIVLASLVGGVLRDEQEPTGASRVN